MSVEVRGPKKVRIAPHAEQISPMYMNKVLPELLQRGEFEPAYKTQMSEAANLLVLIAIFLRGAAGETIPTYVRYYGHLG
ncbi:hypothetical protein L226DRAFT_539076 [Lentinus tigrinus ALCF2SS1-7]|uniref:uncharacterized protein n=1 Tax=Lentinus tigrinus ALCF2SS1-7 TaxID=1328758 RepID=UPI0011661752|nr:hypothetical protein L226DRAFT_539076 [Lentinus tigrinus ALCF2SS1-7]